ncbi:MAG: YHS domain-containing protein [Sedimentisphaerales bacterium]|nr:YHS domain-containing protein [Sedimentisphaerales bacterium]
MGKKCLSSIGVVTLLMILLAGCSKKEQPGPAHQPAPEKAPVPEANQPVSPNTPGAAAIEQTDCPVMGGPIDRNIFVEYQCKKVYFCCEACKEAFNKEPEKYLAKLPQFKQ